MSDALPTLVAFYLPQFHPIPENDEWWGRGFTEWTNVTRAKPLFRGHHQPHLPADLGFYDLRVPETRQAQATLAARYGIGAFCYYHYWFTGHRVLDRPFNDVLSSGQPDFPFCLCWANEDWTRAWDGRTKEILLHQEYSPEDDRAHLETLLPAFDDPRYLRHEGRPIFLVYRARNLPDPIGTTRRWREIARAHGIGDLCLLRVESFPNEHGDPRELGFDAAVDFQPEWRALPEGRWTRRRRKAVDRWNLPAPKTWRHAVYSYKQVMEMALARPLPDYPIHPGVAPAWDNSPRRSTGAIVLRDTHPDLYQWWLSQIIDRQKPQYVFINAWNEWAEGCHLEPCQRWGHAYLKATLAALKGSQPATRASIQQELMISGGT